MSSEQTADATLTFIEGLADLHPKDGDAPHIQKLETVEGATLIRLGFTAGQVMDEHRAPAPILVQGLVGDITFSTADRTVNLVPGTVLHLGGGVVHKLVANTDSVALLTLLK